MIRIKGAVLISRLALIRELESLGGIDRVLAALSPAEREDLTGLLPSDWYSFDLGKRLDQAIVQVLGGGDPRFFERLGEASAEKNLRGVHKGFVAAGNPHGFLSKAPLHYSSYYDTGHREYQKVGPKEALLTTYDSDTFSEGDCATVVGWYRRALKICGVKNPKVEEETCRSRGGAFCRYRITWE